MGSCSPRNGRYAEMWRLQQADEAHAANGYDAVLAKLAGMLFLRTGRRCLVHCAAMETKWIEDFISLAETRSFSRSAQLRHITQPAFSRRIQSLEAWAGIDLVDRSSYPTRLTPAGETFHAQALEIIGSLQATRNMMRGHAAAGADVIEFAVPHSLAFTFFPHWVMDLRKRFGAMKSRLIALNVHDAVLHLTEGGCDLLLAYHHPSQPLALNPERYEMLSLGEETLAAYAKADAERGAAVSPPGHGRCRCPFPQLRLGGLPRTTGRGHHPRRAGTAAARAHLRDRHGRGSQGDGHRRPWPRVPADRLGRAGGQGGPARARSPGLAATS